MYFPKSQIKSNLYTNGNELIYLDSGLNYKGYYFKTSDEQFFSGKNPDSKPNIELTVIDLSLQNINSKELIPNQADWVISEGGYLLSTKIDTTTKVDTPKYYYPQPTPEDYEKGEFNRFFLKKTNEIKFIEISQIEYLKYLNQDSNVQYELYSPLQISWDLIGDKEQVYKTNKNTAFRNENLNNFSGFTQYFKERFTQFYK